MGSVLFHRQMLSQRPVGIQVIRDESLADYLLLLVDPLASLLDANGCTAAFDGGAVKILALDDPLFGCSVEDAGLSRRFVGSKFGASGLYSLPSRVLLRLPWRWLAVEAAYFKNAKN